MKLNLFVQIEISVIRNLQFFPVFCISFGKRTQLGTLSKRDLHTCAINAVNSKANSLFMGNFPWTICLLI